VGKDLKTAVEDLKKLRQQFNLSFDILALKLDRRFDEIVIADENLIADLQTLYMAERNEIVCCLEDLGKYTDDNKSSILFFLTEMAAVVFNIQGSSFVLNLVHDFFEQWLDAYMITIKEMVESLAPDIKEFDFPRMMQSFPAFTSFTSAFKYIVNTWGDVEAYMVYKMENGGNAGARWLMSDLISVVLNFWELYLDKVTDDCILGKFYTIYSTFIERVKTFSLFSSFNKRIHGMEHIAGTTRGGTFILVYTDEDDRQIIEGKLIDDKGKALEGAMIMDDETGIFYGYTNDEGFYNVNVPRATKNLSYMKSGYVSGTNSVRGRKAAKMTINSYNSAAAGGNAENLYMKDTDRMFVNMKATIDGLTEIDKSFNKLGEFVNLNPGNYLLPGMSFEPRSTYRVVADFYLPHLIHNYKTEIIPRDACERLGEVKMIDFQAISDALSKDFTKKNGGTVLNGLKSFMGGNV
jgi:hypothetical protein